MRPEKRNKVVLTGAGLAAGFAYGLLLRLAASTHWAGAVLPIMSVAFLFLLPFAVGFVSIFLIERRRDISIASWLLLPWIPVVAGTVATMVVLLEGLICAIMFLPIGCAAASLGGLLGGGIATHLRSRAVKNASLAGVLLLPLLVGPWERIVLKRGDLRTVNTEITIQAPSGVVWQNIERVRAIRREELPSSWSRAIGFPDPVEASLSYEGAGGIRHATFSGGVLFIETIDVWAPRQKLAFSIQAQGDQTPKTTLDEHVRVGGEFFDVLRGEYELETLADNTTRLRLTSRHRVSTDFNWYASLWTDAVMRDLQKRILVVIKNRCEGQSHKTVLP
jgi:hypothetical protein